MTIASTVARASVEAAYPVPNAMDSTTGGVRTVSRCVGVRRCSSASQVIASGMNEASAATTLAKCVTRCDERRSIFVTHRSGGGQLGYRMAQKKVGEEWNKACSLQCGERTIGRINHHPMAIAPPLRRAPAGSLGEAIELAFERGGFALPVFVSRTPALVVSTVVTLYILWLGLRPILEDKRAQESSPHALKRARWMVLLAVLLLVCSSVHEFLADRVYMVSNYKLNAQHFANVYWLEKYCNAARQRG